MTDQHPLTDHIIDTFDSYQNNGFEDVGECNSGFIYDDLRAAADWQLEQVLEWLKTNTEDYLMEDYLMEDYYSTYFLTEAFIEDLKKAMRPTTTQEDN